MLTPDNAHNEGKKTRYTKKRAGYLRKDLKTFLEKCVKENRRNIAELHHYFANFSHTHLTTKHVDFFLYHNNSHPYFTHENRKTYFENIPQKELRNAVILVDPDIGIEVKSASPKTYNKYITYDEIRFLFNKMDQDSILIIFQYIPRRKREEYFQTLKHRLLDAFTDVRKPNIHYISDNQIVFFILTKSRLLDELLHKILKKYAYAYNLTYSS